MCKAFSCLITREGCVIWEAGIDSHDKLFEKYKNEFNLKDDTLDKKKMDFARIEISPDNKEKYEYLYPEKKWKFQVDESIRPIWLNETHEKNCFKAFNLWKNEIYTDFNYQEARQPIHPFKIEPPVKMNKKFYKNAINWWKGKNVVTLREIRSIGLDIIPEKAICEVVKKYRGLEICWTDPYGKLHYIVYFRSWDLYTGWPSNLAAIQLMKEAMADQIGVEDGELIAISKGLHLYSHNWKLAELIVGV
jgi:hypothetical protein